MLTYAEKLQIDAKIKELYDIIAFKELHMTIAHMLANISDFGIPPTHEGVEYFIDSWVKQILGKLEKCKEDAINTISSSEWCSRVHKRDSD